MDNGLAVRALSFDKQGNYLLYGDYQHLHIRSAKQDKLFDQLQKLMEGVSFSEQEWKETVGEDVPKL